MSTISNSVSGSIHCPKLGSSYPVLLIDYQKINREQQKNFLECIERLGTLKGTGRLRLSKKNILYVAEGSKISRFFHAVRKEGFFKVIFSNRNIEVRNFLQNLEKQFPAYALWLIEQHNACDTRSPQLSEDLKTLFKTWENLQALCPSENGANQLKEIQHLAKNLEFYKDKVARHSTTEIQKASTESGVKPKALPTPTTEESWGIPRRIEAYKATLTECDHPDRVAHLLRESTTEYNLPSQMPYRHALFFGCLQELRKIALENLLLANKDKDAWFLLLREINQKIESVSLAYEEEQARAIQNCPKPTPVKISREIAAAKAMTGPGDATTRKRERAKATIQNLLNSFKRTPKDNGNPFTDEASLLQQIRTDDATTSSGEESGNPFKEDDLPQMRSVEESPLEELPNPKAAITSRMKAIREAIRNPAIRAEELHKLKEELQNFMDQSLDATVLQSAAQGYQKVSAALSPSNPQYDANFHMAIISLIREVTDLQEKKQNQVLPDAALAVENKDLSDEQPLVPEAAKPTKKLWTLPKLFSRKPSNESVVNA